MSFLRPFIPHPILIATLFVYAASSSCQTVADSESKVSSPVSVSECQGINNCATWVFIGKKGSGKWPTGEEALLDLEKLENNQIKISRTDVTGSKAGLTATYYGTLENGEIGGSYTASYQGKPSSGHWYWVANSSPDDGSMNLPEVMHFCDANCTVFKLEGSHYVDQLSNGVPFLGGKWINDYKVICSFDSFTADRVILHCKSTGGGYNFDTIFSGRMNANHNMMVNALDPHHTVTYVRLAWGDALGTVPESNVQQASNRGGFAQQDHPITFAEAVDAGKTIVSGAKTLVEIWNILSLFM